MKRRKTYNKYTLDKLEETPSLSKTKTPYVSSDDVYRALYFGKWLQGISDYNNSSEYRNSISKEDSK